MAALVLHGGGDAASSVPEQEEEEDVDGGSKDEGGDATEARAQAASPGPPLHGPGARSFRNKVQGRLHELAVMLGDAPTEEEAAAAKAAADAEREAAARLAAEEKRRPVLRLTRHLDEMAFVPDKALSDRADAYVRGSRELRLQEADEREAALALRDGRPARFVEDEMTYDDFVLLYRRFHVLAVHGQLRILRMPREGWPFCGRLLDPPTARRLDRDHSLGLDLVEVLHHFHPKLSMAETTRLSTIYERAYLRQQRANVRIVADRLPIDLVNEYARAFALIDTTRRGRVTLEELEASMAGSSLVSPSVVRNMFAKHSRVRHDGDVLPAGVRFMDFECFVNAAHSFTLEEQRDMAVEVADLLL